jgi:acid phosphatase
MMLVDGIMCGSISDDPFYMLIFLTDDCSPFLPYESISRNGTRLAKVQRLVEFQNDVKANTLPQYAHISPNMMNDGHNTTLDFAAKWSKEFLMPLLANEQFMKRTLVLLTYDESATYPIANRIVSILLGGAVPAALKGTKDDTLYTHYSILSTLENNWSLPNLGRYDVGANVFDLVAKETGYANHAPTNVASVNNSLSYGGFLNKDPAMYKPIPNPNLELVGAGGQGVDHGVKLLWGIKAKENGMTPYDGSGDLYDGGDGTTNPNAPVYKAQGPAT